MAAAAASEKKASTPVLQQFSSDLGDVGRDSLKRAATII